MNYFDLFEIEPAFVIDEKELRKKFYEKSRQFHPDMFGTKSAQDQVDALEKSTQINNAFKVLADDDERMKYLLEINGIEFAEGKESVPQEFLMEVMDINEQLMEYKMQPGEELRKDIQKQLSLLKSNLLNSVGDILDNYNHHQTESKKLELIKDYYLKRKYLNRIESNLEN